ncbi:Omp28 family outer membrane lipoprotein [Bacteroides pyogenes]|uniref:Omp28 family outer membrane lipoprotein n=1 Tax=Bacteroides pyogenes TaxID=310300 RepID=UPI003B427B2A
MKTNLKYVIAYTALLLSAGACEQIGNNERWTPEEENLLPEKERSTVLVEEYTGQNCINCPTAAAELKKISGSYPKNVITVSMHAARTGQVREELASEAADAYAAEYDIPGSVPGILINRRNLSGEGKYSQKKALWSSLIRRAVNTKAGYRIDLSAEQTAGKKFDIKVAAFSLQEKAASAKLGIQLWAVEDIRAEQMLPAGKKTDYFHHNVLRGALNGNSGADYTLGKTYHVQVALPETVKEASNAKIIAFLFDRDTKEVYEAAIVALGQGIQPDEADETSEEEKPEAEKKEGISFRYNDETISSGSTIKASKIELSGKDGAEMEVISSLIYTIPGKKHAEGEYTLEITKENHPGKEFGGLSQICAGGQCQDSPSTEKFTKEPYELNEEDFIQIHYKIAKARENEKTDYRTRLSIKHNGKEVAYIHIIFSYDPEKRPEKKPEDPTPEPIEPAPVPEPEPEPNPAPSPLPPAQPQEKTKSNVLVMDFTGQRCGYCIYEIRELAALEEEYHPNLIVVGIHTSHYNVNRNFTFNQWYEYADKWVTGYPTIIFNNKVKSRNLSYQAKEHIGKAPVLSSELKAKVNARSVELSFKATAVKGKEGELGSRKLNVLFWVTENGLQGYQAGEGYDFIHNHILRGYLNGLWGEEYALNTKIDMQKGLPEKVLVPQNCELIAIVLDAETKEFLDAVKVKL